MIKLLLSLLFISLLSAPVISQENSIWEEYPNFGIIRYQVILTDNLEDFSNYQNPLFKSSKLITAENAELNSIKIRYNVKTDVMECEVGSQHGIIKSPEKLKEIIINGECFEHKKYLVKKDTVSGYLQRISHGNPEIYAKHFVSSSKDKLGLSKLNSYYLIQTNGNIPSKVHSTDGLISRFYKGLIKEAKYFEKNNHLDLKNPQDLKRLLTYLDELSKDIVASR